MTIEQLIAERACQNLIVDFAACVDARDFAGLRALCVAELSFARPSDPDNVITGIDAVIAAYAARPAQRLTQHLCTNLRITLDSPTSARGASRILLLAGDAAGPFVAGKGRKAESQLVGSFDDEFVLTAEGWRFRARRGRLAFHV